jgi:hypothetical protein
MVKMEGIHEEWNGQSAAMPLTARSWSRVKEESSSSKRRSVQGQLVPGFKMYSVLPGNSEQCIPDVFGASHRIPEVYIG